MNSQGVRALAKLPASVQLLPKSRGKSQGYTM